MGNSPSIKKKLPVIDFLVIGHQSMAMERFQMSGIMTPFSLYEQEKTSSSQVNKKTRYRIYDISDWPRDKVVVRDDIETLTTKRRPLPYSSQSALRDGSFVLCLLELI